MRKIAPYALIALALLGCRTKDLTVDSAPITTDDSADDSAAELDADGDGVPASEDCDDADPGVYPGATEVCDGVDNDCDGAVDDADEGWDRESGVVWYSDEDGDGYGGSAGEACEAPSGSVAEGGDCDDSDPAISPEAVEVCDGVDNDCDGLTDTADDSLDWSTASEWFTDGDGDGYGDAAIAACEQPSGSAEVGGDCDDTDAAVSPSASEVCDGVDNDCDGAVDDADESLDASSTTTWYVDGDGDGYGAAEVSACDQPSGAVSVDGDCDDSDAAVEPGAAEVCDGVDNDCDGLTDDADGSLDISTQSTYYADADADGYGDAASSSDACDAPSGAVSDSSDCDDSDAGVNPGEIDGCDGVDNDCDSSVDEAALDGLQLVSVDMTSTTGTAYAIDTSTGAATALSSFSTSASMGVNTVAYDPATGVTWAHDYTASSLYEIDVCDGSAAQVGAHGAGNTCGISFGPGGLFYGIDAINDTLVTFDTATGLATTVGSLGFDLGSCGMTYDCANDELIGISGSDDTIFKIDPSTGAAYDAVTTNFDVGSVGVEYDPISQDIWVSTRGNLYLADPSTGVGVATASANFGGSQDDLIYLPECN